MISRYEQETIITFNAEEKDARIYTCDQRMMRKLQKLAEKTSSYTVVSEDNYSVTYKFPKKLISLRNAYSPTAKQIENAKRLNSHD